MAFRRENLHNKKRADELADIARFPVSIVPPLSDSDSDRDSDCDSHRVVDTTFFQLYVMITTIGKRVSMEKRFTFADRAAAAGASGLSASEQAVVRFFQENREQVLVASAAVLAKKIGTSDAT